MLSRRRPDKTKSYFRPVLVDPSEERRVLDFRPLGFRDVVVLGRYQYARAHRALELHSHGQMIEICYLESGEQTYCIGQQRYSLNGGDLFVTYPDECHGSGEIPQSKAVLYWLLMRMPTRKGRLLSLSPTETQKVLSRLLHLPTRVFPGGEGVGRILRQTMESFERDTDPLRLIKLRHLLLGFLLAVLDASQAAHRRASAEIAAVQRVIAENLDRTLRVCNLARLAHLSESRFKARFKAEVGMPPADYALRQRIDRAKQLLRQGGPPVTKIALGLGFSSTQYFATAFKRYTGQTPSCYRRQRCTGNE